MMGFPVFVDQSGVFRVVMNQPSPDQTMNQIVLIADAYAEVISSFLAPTTGALMQFMTIPEDVGLLFIIEFDCQGLISGEKVGQVLGHVSCPLAHIFFLLFSFVCF